MTFIDAAAVTHGCLSTGAVKMQQLGHDIFASTMMVAQQALPPIRTSFVELQYLFPHVSNFDTSSICSTIPSLPVFISSLLLVTASDMVPFVPCQPLAMTMGAALGVWAYPICITGQTTAGVLAFLVSRKASDSTQVQQVLEGLASSEARDKFEEFKQLGTTEEESKVLLTLIGLRLAPFFPFSAGNYLLGGGTSVGLRPFFLATLLGCLLNNILSVSVGIGGSELLRAPLPNTGEFLIR